LGDAASGKVAWQCRHCAGWCGDATGADYYVAPTASGDLEGAYRLEVSGTNHGDASAVKTRLKEKVEQARAGDSNLPAIACVAGFRERVVAIAEVTPHAKP
jgi:hypothetical protein